MTMQEQFRLAYSGVRALQNLPDKVADLIKPDVSRMFFRHGENKQEMVKAIFALRDMPKELREAAEAAAYDWTWNKEKGRGMRTAKELAWHTPSARRRRDEEERRQAQRRNWQDCYYRTGCEECAARLKAEKEEKCSVTSP